MGEEDARSLLVDLAHLLTLCDTAGVREGLVTDELAGELEEVLARTFRAPTGRPAAEAVAEMERERWRRELPGDPGPPPHRGPPRPPAGRPPAPR